MSAILSEGTPAVTQSGPITIPGTNKQVVLHYAMVRLFFISQVSNGRERERQIILIPTHAMLFRYPKNCLRYFLNRSFLVGYSYHL